MRVDFIIPHIENERGTRIIGLVRCLDSIRKINYPQELINVLVVNGPQTAPEKVKWGVENTTGDLIVFGANDMEFTPDCLWKAVLASQKHALVAFKDGELREDKSNICTHFLIRRDFLPQIGGEIFDTRYYHTYCDNILWAKASKLGQAIHLEDAEVLHLNTHHFDKDRTKWDSVYKKAYNRERVKHDYDLYAKDLLELTKQEV